MTRLSKQNGFIVKPFTALLIVLLLSGAAGFYWLSGVINQQQDTIAEWVSDKLGQPVEIEQAKLSWLGLSPKLELEQVKIYGDDQSVQLLSLKQLYLDLDLFGSILNTDLRLDDITLIGLKIGVVRDQNGQIALRGLNQQGDSTPLFAEMLVKADVLDSFHLQDITVDWSDRKHSNLTGRYRIDNAVVKHQSTKWHADGLIDLPPTLGETIGFDVDWVLNQQQPERTTWQWRVRASEMVLAPLRSYLQWDDVMMRQGRMALTAKANGVGNKFKQLELDVDLTQAQLVNAAQSQLTPVVIEKLTGEFDWQRQPQGWSLQTSNAQLEMNNRLWPKTRFKLTMEKGLIATEGNFIRIQDLVQLASISGQAPEQWLAQQPSGDITDYQLSYHQDEGLQATKLKLEKAALTAWQDYPGINNITANIEFANKQAEIQLLSEQVTIFPATWLKDTVFLDTMTGRVKWLQATASTWQLQADQFKVVNDDLQIQIAGGIQQTAEGTTINNLLVQLQDIAVARWKSYVPTKILDDDFREWSEHAFQAGTIRQGQIRWNGDLAAFPYESQQDKARGQFDLDLQVEGVQLHYADEWPDLFDIAGTITGQGNNLAIRSQQANIAGFSVQNVDVDIEKLIEAKPVLTAKGDLQGTTQKAFNFLQNSPLKARFGSIARAVKAKGKTNIELALTVPLADTINTWAEGKVDFNNSEVTKKNMPELAIKQVNGELHFNNDGVTADSLKGQFLNRAMTVNVFPRGNATIIAANGLLSSGKLRQTWPEQMPDFIVGQTPYQIEVSVSERSIGDFYVDVEMTSDLKGLALKLPSPMAKSANDKKPLKVDFDQSAANPVLTLQYDKQTVMAIKGIGSDSGHLALSIKTPNIDAEQWLDWVQKQPQSTSSSLVKTVRLDTDNLSGFGQQFSPFSAKAQRNDSQWSVQLNSSDLAGEIAIPDTNNNMAPLKVRLDKLAVQVPEGTDTTSTDNMSLWPALTVDIAELLIDGKPLGQLSLKAQTQANTWRIDKASLKTPEYDVVMTEGQWSKQAGQDMTSVSLYAETRDIAGTLNKLDYLAAIEAEKASAEVNLSWPANPLAFSQQIVSGALKFRLKKGKLIEVEPGAAGRVFGLLSITAIPRRLSLDFNELFGKGFNFRSIKGNFAIADGQATTEDMVLKSEAAEIAIAGTVNLVDQTYDQQVKIRPNVSSTLPIAGAVAGGPIGLGVGTAILLADKLADKLFDKEIVNVISYTYGLTGPWEDPQLQLLTTTLPKL